MLRSNNNRNFVSSSNIETNNVENFLEWTRTDVYNFPRKIGTTSSSDRLLSPAEEGKIRRTGNRLTSNNRPGYPFQYFNRCKNDSWTRGKDARDSRKFQGVDITVWNLLLAEIWEYVLTDLIVKIIVIKSGPLKITQKLRWKIGQILRIIAFHKIPVKFYQSGSNSGLENPFSNQRMYPNSVRTRTDFLLSKNFPLPSNLEKQLVQIKWNLICSPNIGSKKPFPRINV